MTTAEKSSRKKLQNVPPATEPTPTEPTVEPEAEPEVAEQPSPFPREEIEKAFNNPMLKGFKKYLDPLLSYFESVEARMQAFNQNFKVIGESFEQLQPLIQLSQQVQQRQQQGQQTGAAPAATGGADIMSLVAQFAPLLAGGGSNAMTEEITKRIVDAGIEQMFMGTKLLKAVETKILTDMGAKIAVEAANK